MGHAYDYVPMMNFSSLARLDRSVPRAQGFLARRGTRLRQSPKPTEDVMSVELSHGCNLREAVVAARQLGVAVIQPRGTGHLRFAYADLKSVFQHIGRKDATRAVVRFLRRVMARRAGGGAVPAPA